MNAATLYLFFFFLSAVNGYYLNNVTVLHDNNAIKYIHAHNDTIQVIYEANGSYSYIFSKDEGETWSSHVVYECDDLLIKGEYLGILKNGSLEIYLNDTLIGEFNTTAFSFDVSENGTLFMAYDGEPDRMRARYNGVWSYYSLGVVPDKTYDYYEVHYLDQYHWYIFMDGPNGSKVDLVTNNVNFEAPNMDYYINGHENITFSSNGTHTLGLIFAVGTCHLYNSTSFVQYYGLTSSRDFGSYDNKFTYVTDTSFCVLDEGCTDLYVPKECKSFKLGYYCNNYLLLVKGEPEVILNTPTPVTSSSIPPSNSDVVIINMPTVVQGDLIGSTVIITSNLTVVGNLVVEKSITIEKGTTVEIAGTFMMKGSITITGPINVTYGNYTGYFANVTVPDCHDLVYGTYNLFLLYTCNGITKERFPVIQVIVGVIVAVIIVVAIIVAVVFRKTIFPYRDRVKRWRQEQQQKS